MLHEMDMQDLEYILEGIKELDCEIASLESDEVRVFTNKRLIAELYDQKCVLWGLSTDICARMLKKVG